MSAILRFSAAALVLTAVLLPWSSASGQGTSSRTVLAVHLGGEFFPTSPVVNAAIREQLGSGSGTPIEYFTEYLESDRFAPEEVSEALRAYIKRKYQGRRIDLVIAIADPALQFVLETRADLFPDAPVVFSGLRAPDEAARTTGAGATGLLLGVAYSETLNFALTLHPGTRRVFVVAQGQDEETVDSVEAELAPFSRHVDLTFVREPTVSALLEVVKAVPPASLILYIWHSQERGDLMYPDAIARLVAEASPVPVYGTSDFYMGSGVVGGVMRGTRETGLRIGEIARRILSGTRALDIPVQSARVVPTVDWRQIQRWGIDPSRLPVPSDIRYRAPTAWQTYRRYFVGSILVIAFQLMLIAGLLLQAARRRRAEARLHTNIELLNLLDQLTRGTGARQDLRSVLQIVLRGLEDHLPLDFCCVYRYDKATDCFVLSQAGVKGQLLALELSMPEHCRIPSDENGLATCLRGELIYEADTALAAAPIARRFALAGLRSLVAAPLALKEEVLGVLFGARGEPSAFSSAECEFLRQLSEHVALSIRQADLYAALQQAYDDLRKTYQAAMQQERLTALGQIASGIAHDINNAISPATVYIELLLENQSLLPEQARAHLSTIQHAIEDVADTVDRMREFYRKREPDPRATPVNINQTVQEALGLTRSVWTRTPEGATVTVSADLASDNPMVVGVTSDIRGALVNLILNAADAMPGGGRLTIRTYSNDRVRVEVSDTGVGMDEETRRRCLEPFFTTKGERGTGLGLATVYGMIQRHEGGIEIQSEPDKGTTVRLSFPTPDPAVAAGPVPQAQPSLQRLRILIIDDNPLLLRSLREVLEAESHVVTVADAGEVGIQLFATAQRDGIPFDVVITDLGLPGFDGHQVIGRIKERSPTTPVILLTGWGQRLAGDDTTPQHFDRVLAKPPKLADLRAALADLTVSRR
jgi:signal transduction histidine kinase/ActR/RegA family two-component response regulator/ABC-type uncharacterized transport system substrate-binding protein